MARDSDAADAIARPAVVDVLAPVAVDTAYSYKVPAGLDLKPGDFVVGPGGWQLYALSDGAGFSVIDVRAAPMQAYLGVLGMPGVTAWYGLNKIIKPKAGETIVVSAATPRMLRS